ncbi:single-stranded-DNA-specific exonuclease RecJ [Solidesulfovibrio carbinoliphilus subsp. oakridgensis]|uniref:Single-stranded-DNA-specific exonuclease RecJ n=1 Tax=Solidesulfovibrio carbinoliphilus subsp. oakridgensis TaxID=694327 RepID=G7Q4N2_9BACT|nr:single-stranded-DNA-specific exonuclease RecJ [Solidesulfovibrio carbinoliphilus]EHJ47492.1 single-stranded-DNA-specific exonuclease RecJ [Solidesulfovibrio carbinoliphilus subsp. oakridgensis]
MSKKWIFPSQGVSAATADALAEALGLSPAIAALLYHRGLTTAEAMDAYLCPGLRLLMRPDEIPGMEAAAALLAEALVAGRTVAVWGDYDVDGITGTALLVDFLRERGFSPLWRLPERAAEGYGLNIAGIEELARDGASLLVTVDCGIGGIAEVARARELGLDVIVTDHHLPGPELPPANAVANPKLGPGPGTDLAGVGVAFFLAAAVNRLLPGEPTDVRRLLDLVALGTLADVVPLCGPNRILAKNGLLLLAEARRPGIHALKEASGHNPKAALGASQVTFGLAPRINAAGRMGRPDAALALLLAPDLDTARPLAAELDAENTRRRAEEDAILAEAMDQAAERPGRFGLTLFAPHWHQGVIGIVASRVAERRYRPTLILTADEAKGLLKGSGRSIPECDLHGLLTEIGEVLNTFGGHKMAAGLSIVPDNLSLLAERFDAAAAKALGPVAPLPSLKLDAELSFGAVTAALVREIGLMEPFGCGNPEPVFASPPVKVLSRRGFGDNHVALSLRDPAAGVTLRGKAWRMASDIRESLAGATVRVAFTPKITYFSGVPEIELRLRDIGE